MPSVYPYVTLRTGVALVVKSLISAA